MDLTRRVTRNQNEFRHVCIFRSHLESCININSRRQLRESRVVDLTLHPAFRNDNIPRVPEHDGGPAKQTRSL